MLALTGIETIQWVAIAILALLAVFWHPWARG